MKKTIYILVSVLVLVFFTGHFFLYKYIQHSHKIEFKNYLKNNPVNVQEIEISPSELFVNTKTIMWLDENQEIEMNHERYDVMGIKSSGTKVILLVIIDKVEKILFEKYKFQANTIYTGGTEKNNTTLKDFLSLKVTLDNPLNTPCLLSNTLVLFAAFFFRFCSGYETTLIKPPLS